MKFLNKTIGYTFSALFSLMILFNSCKKFIDIKAPVTSTNAENMFSSDATAASVLTGIYSTMSQIPIGSGGVTSLSLIAGLSADELTLYPSSSNTSYVRYYKNALSTTPSLNPDYWKIYYPLIFTANSAIEGISKSTELTPSIKNQLLGEAKFIRAFFYFYLVNLYGDVPLVLTSDYSVNSTLARTSKSAVWQQVIADLKEAQDLLGTEYLKADIFTKTTDRVRPTKWAAAALLSRVYLYNNDWVNAESLANTIIVNSNMYDTVSLNGVFLKNSKEAIWQLQPVNTGWNSEDARIFVLTGAPSSAKPVFLSSQLLNSFEIGDNRKNNWVNSITVSGTTYYFPYKYKVATQNSPVTEYMTVLRLGEQYLIRAEARAQQNKISEAQSDLNVVRRRAGLPNTFANDKASLLTAILHERQVELFTEWGHRWLDLKRTNTLDAVMSVVTPQKTGTWEPIDQLYPIPLSELQSDPNLIQNPGYQ
jgi:hypothetical protein